MLRSTTDHFSTIRGIIEKSSRAGRAIELDGVEGLSGDALIGALQRLAVHQTRLEAGCYLEIGVFRGLTLLSVAAAASETPAYGVDNFTQLDADGENERTVRTLRERHGLRNANVLNADFEEALERLPDEIPQLPVGLYFVDGPHDYRSQLLCLELAKPHLSEAAIVVVDDSNYVHVRQANRDFLRMNADFTLLFEAYTPCHPSNMTRKQLEAATKGWWNGVNVLVRDTTHALPRALPPVPADRSPYFQDHVTHALQYAHIAPHATELVGALLRLRLLRAGKSLVRVMGGARSGTHRRKFPNVNTESEDLPGERWNGGPRRPS